MDFWARSAVTLRKPIHLLALVFVIWKTLLIVVVLSSPGPGYDTSTSLLDFLDPASTHQSTLRPTPIKLRPTILKFVRWDAIYYTHMAREGHIFEQEWAFGLGFSSPVAVVTAAISQWTTISRPLLQIAVAIVISHASHFLTVVILYALSQRVLRSYGHQETATSVLAAILHIISPAGAFLSAPYSESLFSFFHFLGLYLYIGSRMHISKHADLDIVLAGLCIGCAAVVRSNGILSGLPFLYDAILQLLDILKHGASAKKLRKMSVVIIAGCLIAAGLALPQFLAYKEYCKGTIQHERRPWCNSTFPSIYGFVQKHYWNVGMFQYWTLGNLPLFLLAMPCLSVLTISSSWTLTHPKVALFTSYEKWKIYANTDRESLLRLAMPQIVLALAALTVYHVQIINRIASGYPLWYIWLALMITKPRGDGQAHLVRGRKASQVMVSLMAMYAIVQGGLFASFLPPA